jgi:hypothetical protein
MRNLSGFVGGQILRSNNLNDRSVHPRGGASVLTGPAAATGRTASIDGRRTHLIRIQGVVGVAVQRPEAGPDRRPAAVDEQQRGDVRRSPWTSW